MKSTTGGQHSFAQIPSVNLERSAFNRSCGYKTTFDSGYLIPVFADEGLPGDTMSLRMTTFARMATPAVPLLDNLYLDSHFFAVPIRLIWENWAKFNGQQDTPGDSTSYVIPVMTEDSNDGAAQHSISDYLGIPTGVLSLEHSSLWHRAYNLIWAEWFRDENLQDPPVLRKTDAGDLWTDFPLRRRGKRHDYFSSCMPWPQKGDSVLLPLGTSAPVVATTAGLPNFTSQGTGNMTDAQIMASSVDTNAYWSTQETDTGGHNVGWGDTTGLETNLTQATAATINQIRQAFAVQKLYERDARGGTRYTEVVRAHFGVISPDARLQRPEYLGGGTQTINMTPIPSTNGASGSPATPLGGLGAYATSTGDRHSFNKSFTEHCVVLGFVSVRADLNYQQGLNRMFSRSTRWDFYWPALAHIGEQVVKQGEIFAKTLAADNDIVFGYQERWAEYRYKPSQITGAFRSSADTPLDVWHLAQDFPSAPVLNGAFIEEDPPVQRVIAVPGEPEFLFDAFFNFKHVRPMPTYSVPGMVDHF